MRTTQLPEGYAEGFVEGKPWTPSDPIELIEVDHSTFELSADSLRSYACWLRTRGWIYPDYKMSRPVYGGVRYEWWGVRSDTVGSVHVCGGRHDF